MKIFFDIIGCRLNQSEVEGLANIFRALGHQIVGDPAEADVAIVNTCAVTVKAAADSRKKLRRAARQGAAQVIATGCWASLYPAKALALAGVTDVVNNDEKENLVSKILGISPEALTKLELIRKPLPGDRGRTRAFIKVQEGCDNHCTYCLTRLARGKSRSRSLEEISGYIQAAIAGDAKEIVLTGVQLGGWGRDLAGSTGMADLLDGVLSISGYQRLRLSSIEPWDFSPDLLQFWSDKRLCRHLHIPLQSGSAPILKAMGRPITKTAYRQLTDDIRDALQDVAITTDVIVGFPGETDQEFESTKQFIQSIRFAGGHVFTYSPRLGTAAYKMKGQVPIQIAKERNVVLRGFFEKSGRDYRERYLGRQVDVLWESSQETEEGLWNLSGLTDTYIRVYGEAGVDLWNQITPVVLESHHSRRKALIGSVNIVSEASLPNTAIQNTYK
jgi:threonylcarbamoyladenosine tRNA methylthiotransferase MtaB